MKTDDYTSIVLLREKHRRLSDENELLKTRLRETNETIIKTDGKQNSMVRELKLATEESDRYLEEMGRLSKRVSLLKVRFNYLPERKFNTIRDVVNAANMHFIAPYISRSTLSQLISVRINQTKL